MSDPVPSNLVAELREAVSSGKGNYGHRLLCGQAAEEIERLMRDLALEKARRQDNMRDVQALADRLPQQVETPTEPADEIRLLLRARKQLARYAIADPVAEEITAYLVALPERPQFVSGIDHHAERRAFEGPAVKTSPQPIEAGHYVVMKADGTYGTSGKCIRQGDAVSFEPQPTLSNGDILQFKSSGV